MLGWKKCKVNPNYTILEVLKIIDDSALQIAIVVDAQGRLLGTVTDGDIRRAILRGIHLNECINLIMNTSPVTVYEKQEQHTVLMKMQDRELAQLPVINEKGVVVDIVSLKELTYQKKRDNAVLLMVGGLGTRLRPLTAECPKPMLKIGNKPILETIVENFIECGFHNFYFAVNYKADIIEEYFGDGRKFGVHIEYIHEKERLGTAGALSLLPTDISTPIIVMNGDLLTKVNFAQFLDYHEKQKVIATMAVREYNYQVPYGVINFSDNMIVDIKEKPSYSCFVNAGIYTLSKMAISKIDKEEFLDMPDLFNELINDKASIAAFPIREYWLDIGRMADFKKAQFDYSDIFK